MTTVDTWRALINRYMNIVRQITGSPVIADRIELRRILSLTVRAERKLRAAEIRAAEQRRVSVASV